MEISKPVIYLDTSIISAYFDWRNPVRQLITRKWFSEQAANFTICVSTLVLAELSATAQSDLRMHMLQLTQTFVDRVFEETDAAVELAQEYRSSILAKEVNDTLHIAIASLNEVHAIVSWNFKHIVNLETMRQIHFVNHLHALSPVEIITIENIGGDQYGSY